jgi:TPR repeat protein
MKIKRPKENNVIDPSMPWKLPIDDSYTSSLTNYAMSAAEWSALLQKAEDGDPEAQWEIADRYHDGCRDEKGVVLVEASEWFRKSAEAGFMPAQNNFGNMLGDGDGVAKDPDNALRWLKKAWKGGDQCAPQNIAITYRDKGNLKRAFHWFNKGAEAGDDDAVLQIGIHYFWGRGIRKDYSKAIDCFKKAIKGKNISEASRDDAHFYLALAYLEGKGVTKSIPNAKKLLKRANIDNDHPAARALLQELKSKP